MSTLAEKIEPLAVDVALTDDALRVVLADGREISAPLQWFPRLLRATSEQRKRWELIGDGTASTGHRSTRTSRSKAFSPPDGLP